MHDAIRTKVLEVFFVIYQDNPLQWTASSEIIKRLLTSKKTDILAAIEFLEDEQYVKIKKTATGRKRYKISTKGLNDFIPSKFTSQSLSQVSVATNGGIFVFGDNLGSIKQETVQSFEEINDLIRLIKNSTLSENNKRQLIGDAETIKVQLTKPQPDKSIIKKAWRALKEVSNINDTIELLKTISEEIRPFLR